MRRIDTRELRRFRQFYGAYPQIREAVTPILAALPLAQRLGLPEIRESLTPESGSVAQAGTSTGAGTLQALHSRLLLERLPFTHFAELVQICGIQSLTFHPCAAIVSEGSSARKSAASKAIAAPMACPLQSNGPRH